MGKRKKERPSKTNKYDNLSKPQAEFDFHDRGILSPEDMRNMVDAFITDCRNRVLTKVLIITGKGLHSRGGAPVVKPFVKKHLLTKPYVSRVYESRSDRGGSGALEITLNY